MSEYQYYEFCSIYSPLTAEARKELRSLSGRASVGTHGASYIYNYRDFRGNPKQLLLKYFDVFFYISKFGIVRLMFKYQPEQIDIAELQKYLIKNVISCEQKDQYIVLDIELNSEEGFGWTEGEGILPHLLPLYEEIKNKNYQLLQIASIINEEFTGTKPNQFKALVTEIKLSSAQKAFIDCVTNS
jgi:hypothetical protein